MSRLPVLQTNQENLVIRNKINEQKEMLARVRLRYDLLCQKVDKTALVLTGLKKERFNVEGLVREMDVRVKVYEMREKELKEQDERAKQSIIQANNRLSSEIEVRNSYDRNFSNKVTDMASEYCDFKNSCDKTRVATNLLELKTSYATFTSEIECLVRKLNINCTESGETNVDEICYNVMQQMYQPSKSDKCEIPAIRELQNLLQPELDLVSAKNAEDTAQIDRLLAKKSSLLKALNSLKAVRSK